MEENALTKVARIAAGSAMGATYKDKDGKQQVIKPTGDANYLDLSGVITNSGSSNDGGGDNPSTPDNPSAGADYYAGSLADGEITERYLLYQRDETVAEQTGSQTVTLQREVGSTFNMAGDGATFLIHLQKTVMTKGAKGAVTDIELNYDTNNAVKDGYFTTTSPYPIYIKASDLAAKETLTIPIRGIGESLSGKNVKAPQLNVIFNGNGTMTFGSVTGYDNDGNSAGATGANYDVVVDVIATFSTQPAVAQMPASVNFFTGSAVGNIALSGVSNFFENSMDGIEITFDDYLITGVGGDLYNYLKLSDIGLSNSILRIQKSELINGYSKKIVNNVILNKQLNWYTLSGKVYSLHSHNVTLTKVNSNFVTFNSGSIDVELNVHGELNYGGLNYDFKLPVLKVTPYKN